MPLDRFSLSSIMFGTTVFGRMQCYANFDNDYEDKLL